MKNGKQSKKIRNNSAESRMNKGASTVSANEATGMLYCPPRSKHDMEASDDLFPLQTVMPQYGFLPPVSGTQGGLTPLNR